MRRKLTLLLTVFVLVLVAAGGAFAAGAADMNITADDSGGATDSGSAGDRVGNDTTANDEQILIPEDQNGDGKMDDRFQSGDDDDADVVCGGKVKCRPPQDGSANVGVDDRNSGDTNQTSNPEDRRCLVVGA